jgi:hypothetical protein
MASLTYADGVAHPLSIVKRGKAFRTGFALRNERSASRTQKFVTVAPEPEL